MTGETKPGDAAEDKWRETFEKLQRESEVAVARVEIRAEQRSLNGEEEDSEVIYVQADKRVAERGNDSDPPLKASPAVIILTVVKKFPPVGAVIVALAGIAAYVALQLLK